MNYKKIYNDLIQKRVNHPPVGYGEKHHVVPRSMNGSNDKTNIVKLTGREHFIAHVLLAKIYGGKMWMAVIRMKNRRGQDKYINSRMYEEARIKWSEWSSQNQRGESHWAHGKPGWNKGKTMPKTTGERHWSYGKPMSETVRQALLKANTGFKKPMKQEEKWASGKEGKTTTCTAKKCQKSTKPCSRKK